MRLYLRFYLCGYRLEWGGSEHRVFFWRFNGLCGLSCDHKGLWRRGSVDSSFLLFFSLRRIHCHLIFVPWPWHLLIMRSVCTQCMCVLLVAVFFLLFQYCLYLVKSLQFTPVEWIQSDDIWWMLRMIAGMAGINRDSIHGRHPIWRSSSKGWRHGLSQGVCAIWTRLIPLPRGWGFVEYGFVFVNM